METSPLSEFAVKPLASGAGADPESPASQAYQEAIAQSMKALEARMNPQTNWWNIAAAFAKPTRGGSFGESLGNVNETLGAEQERAEKEAVPIAQMRAQLAGQKYEMANKEKAYGILAGATGFENPAQAALALQNGQGMVGLSNKFTPELYMQLSRYDPKIAETVKNAAGMDVERFKAIIQAKQAGIDESKLYAMYGKEAVDYLNRNQGAITGIQNNNVPAASGTSSTPAAAKPKGQYDFSPIVQGGRLTSPVGQREGVAHNGLDIAAPLGSPIKAPVTGEVIFAGNGGDKAGNMVTVRDADGGTHSFMHMDKIGVQVGDKIDPSSVIGQVGQTGNARGAHVHYEVKGADGKPVNPLDSFKVATTTGTAKSDTDAIRLGYEKISDTEYHLPFSGSVLTIPPNTPLAEKNQILTEAVKNEQNIFKAMSEDEIKTYSSKRTELVNMRPVELKTQMGDYDNLIKYLTKPEYKNVVGILQKKLPGSDETVMGKFVNALRAVGAGGQEGITAGKLGSISLPVEEMMRTYDLSERERTAFNEIQRIIKSGLINSIAQSGKVLGINPTDADARLFEAAAASTSNLAANTLYWAQMRRAQTEFLHDASRGIRQYQGKHPAAYFTATTSPYMKAEDNFYNNMELIQSKAPGLR